MNIEKFGIRLLFAIFAIVIGYGGLLMYLTWPISEFSVAKSGVFGDSFGVLSSLFSGLAFGGLIIAILLQREDLQLQRTELQLTRQEVKSQNFENTFFQMLRLHNEIVNSIDLRHRDANLKDRVTTGRDCFMVFQKRLQQIYNNVKTQPIERSESEIVNEAYNLFWRNHMQEIGHYFRFLYRIFKFINDSDNSKKRLYSSIARSQLSDQELLMLYYNCLSKRGSERFKPLAETYALFDNLPVSLLFDDSHINFYPASAWGENIDYHARRS